MTIAISFAIRLLAVFMIFFAAACGTANDWRHAPQIPDNAVRIFVVKHGWHTGVVIPRMGKQAPFSFLDPVFGDAAFYEFGWGDREYYPTNDPGIRLALRAVLWPTDSVLHVVALADTPSQSFPGADMEALFISREGYQQLLKYLADHFVLNAQAKPMDIGRGLYGDSRFFESHGSFHAFRTCNTWTAQALQQGGVPIRPFMALTADSVLRQARGIMDDFMQGQRMPPR